MVISGKMTLAMLCALLCAALSLEGCAPSKSSLSAKERQVEPAAAVLQGSRLPLEKGAVAQTELAHFRDMGAQFLYSGDADPYQLAETIYHYRDPNNCVIFEDEFSKISEADPALLIEISAARAPHIDLFSEDFLNADPSAHPARALFDRVLEATGAIGMIAYGEDVRATAKELFGEACILADGDGRLIRYHSDADLYYLPSSPAIITEYPVILSAERIEGGGWHARAVVLSYWDSYNTWACPDGCWQSKENTTVEQVMDFVSSHLESLPQYLYTLLPNGTDGFRLDGFRQL